MSVLLAPAVQVLLWSTRTASASPISSSTIVPVQVGTPTSSPNPNIPTTSPGPPTDGGGQGFSPPAVLWITFCFLVGTPLIIAGVRGWKVTSGVGNGLALVILFYASFINTMNGNGLTDNSNSSDLLLDGIIFIAFLVGVGCGWSKLGTNCGPVLLGACGGLAFAFMALLLRPGLLFGSFYFANWLLAGPLGAAGAAYTIFRQKFGVIFGSAASGSFLLVLAIDLTLNKQSGMSIGLLLLLDQNGSHVTELQKAGYKPTLSTIILAGVGIAAIPVISLTQYLIWKEPFSRTAASLREYQISMHGKPIDIPPEVELPMVPGGKPFAPFNVIGIPMRASEAFDRPMRKEPPLGPSAQGLSAQGLPANSRFSHQ